MIRTPTTFIVGAGASCDYGLPSGRQLRDLACELTPRSSVYQLIYQSGIATVGELNDVLEDLRQHLAPSIDTFLESRQDHQPTMRVGRALIAGLLGNIIGSIRNVRTFGDANAPDCDWLNAVIEAMRAGAATWQTLAAGNTGVRFVTFNFDGICLAGQRSAHPRFPLVLRA